MLKPYDNNPYHIKKKKELLEAAIKAKLGICTEQRFWCMVMSYHQFHRETGASV